MNELLTRITGLRLTHSLSSVHGGVTLQYELNLQESCTNGKAERFIQTLLREWAYAFTYPNSDARSRELPLWMTHYNFHRPHSATGNLPPASRLGFNANNVVRSYS